MLLEQTISITAGRGTTKVLRFAGIDFEMGGTYEVPADKLPAGSNYNIRIRCDYCGAEYVTKLVTRNSNLDRSIVKKDCCKSCQPKKAAEQCKLRYGVDWPTKRPDVQESWKKTNMERYGVENVSQVQKVKDKKEQTFTERYGSPYYLCTQEGRQKARQSFVAHYGADPYNNPDIKHRRSQTCLGKYGVPNAAQSPAVREKMKNTLRERYGVENPMGVPEFAERAKTNRNDPGWIVSKPQRSMYDSLIEMGYDAHLEHHVPWGWLDVAVFLPDGQKLDFEYDGRFWHSSDEQRERDRRRDLASFEDGWKVARFRGDESPPSKKEIEDALTALIDNNQQFYTVELAG